MSPKARCVRVATDQAKADCAAFFTACKASHLCERSESHGRAAGYNGETHCILCSAKLQTTQESGPGPGWRSKIIEFQTASTKKSAWALAKMICGRSC